MKKPSSARLAAKKRTKAPAPAVTSPVPQTYRSVMVRYPDGTIHTAYLTEHGARRIDELTAAGQKLNDAIAAVIPGYITPYKPTKDEPAPDCIIDLGLPWPCSFDDLQRRWRKLAKTHHPDVGGDSAKFIIARQSYQEALMIFGR